MDRTGGRRVIKGRPHNREVTFEYLLSYSKVRDLRWLHHIEVRAALTGT